MKKLFWVLFVFLFAAIIIYTAAPESVVSIGLDPKLALVTEAFALAGIGLGFLGGKNRYKGTSKKKLPDKGEFFLRCAHDLKDHVILYLVEIDSERGKLFEVGKKQLLDKDGNEFTDFTKMPRQFIVMKRDVAEDNGPVRTVYYIIPM